ncbi:unnamed protein product [Spirodela intermedia]|uniref:J domain-containing protein n=1 Tax=Spirodela intermedia TaxID=51605 RepID=A0A7I8LKQ0_SPIIN|nr:unnamed protein product [Spirodela intermedia]
MIRRRTSCSLSSSTSTALFHSTAALDRRRGNQWNPRFNIYTKRLRRMEAKQTLLRNVSKYAEYLFQSWKYDDDRGASTNSSWYEQEYWARFAKTNGSGPQKSQWDTYRNRRKGRFQFCFSDDEEIKTEFRSSFGARQGFYWSFSDKENVHCGYSSGYENRRDSSYWRYKSEQDEDDTSPEVNLASERLALGLSASGPLNLAEVKEAFRACALRWHPDRHHGSSKVEAEERFKSCLAAYQSLSEKLAAG